MPAARDYFKLHFIVFLWGFSAILGKLILIPAAEMVFIRSVLAMIGMALVIYSTKESFTVAKGDLIKLLLIGFIVALHWLAFFGSARVSNVSVSLVGFARNSLWTALLVPLFDRTRVKKFELALGLLVVTGLYIIFSFDFQYKVGLLLGVLAGFTSALFSVFNSKMVKRIGARTITFYEMCGVMIGTGLWLIIYNLTWVDDAVSMIPSASDWIYMTILAGACSVYAYSVSVELMKRVPVFLIQLTLNLEPLYGIVAALILFGGQEKMNLNFYIGTFVILCAVFSYPLMKKRFQKSVLID
jgi:drug/metabolite transporter (DMT)-like permease